VLSSISFLRVLYWVIDLLFDCPPLLELKYVNASVLLLEKSLSTIKVF